MSAARLHARTPALLARDARGLTVRQVDYHRGEPAGVAQRCVTLGRHDLAGQSLRQWDPRLSGRASEVAANQHQLASLSGRPLLTHSSDAGWRLTLPGDAGQVAQAWDSRATHWHSDYDELLRPVLTRETASGQPQRIAERFTYAGEDGMNRRGRLLRHDDEAGSRLIDGYSLGGLEQGETRHFLSRLDLPDWPAVPGDRDALLEPGPGASTCYVHGPLGDLLGQLDALGQQRHWRFNLSGELATCRLELPDGTRHALLDEMHYNAVGQVETQTTGNGVTRQTEYDAATGRVLRQSTWRAAGDTLQDLHYEHDPVGNVLTIDDRSQPTRHFRNQRIDPINRFVYDSLYRLIEASGREAAGAVIGPDLPALAPDPGDTSRLLNYRQHYTYDAGGNLLTLRHIGEQNYTRSLTVAEHSNRAVPSPGDPLAAFDANGNLLQLQPGQPLLWNARNQLHGSRQVGREDGDNDEEHYRYGGDGLRRRKVVTRVVAGRTQTSETRYLPGLELHARPGEQFAVIDVQLEQATLRCLHWSEGRPDGIANPQLRYSLDDLHDSSGLELDGDARIISHEGYYPFGGTAWWAAGSAIEASYKTRRYSGKERDSSGLYDYGLRYYAAWLMRWINPDPAGDVDGLNRYRFVRNNPLTLKDAQGLMNVEKQAPGRGMPPRKPLEQRLEFIEEEFEHEFSDPYTMKSVHIGEDGQRNFFENEFTPEQWTFKSNFKNSPLDIFASDVGIYQYQQVAEEYEFSGVLPSIIKRERVANRETIGRLSGLENGSREMMDVFLNETPNGKSTWHLLKRFGLRALKVTIEPTSWGQDELLSAHVYIDVAASTDEIPADQPPPLPADDQQVVAPPELPALDSLQISQRNAMASHTRRRSI